MPLFSEIALALVLAVVFGFIAHAFRQPPIIGFILAGVTVGLLANPGSAAVGIMDGLAPIGLALLLFLVGLEMNMADLRHVGWPSLVVGLGQTVLIFIVGYFLVTALGFGGITAVYIAIALAFSSTIIVVKLLSEKKELNSLYGRIVVGSLLVEDFVAILTIVILAGLRSDGAPLLSFIETLFKGGVLVGLILFTSRFFPRLLDRIGRSPEMLYLFSIAWVLGVATLTELVGLSVEIGGFLAGLALANSSEHFQIGARMRPVRDFFLILFFVSLGAGMLVEGATVPLGPALILSLFVLIGNPLIVMILMGLLGYRSRTSFLTGLTAAQISEFSLVIAALGLRLGHLDPDSTALVTLVGIVTIFLSSYLIIYGNQIYRLLKPVLRIFEFRRKLVEDTPIAGEYQNHIVLIGVHRTGYSILQTLIKAGAEFVAVDFDPVLVKSLRGKKVPVIYGDIADEEIQEVIGLRKAKAVISTVPDNQDNQIVLNTVKNINKKAKIILTANEKEDATRFYRDGASYVIQPHFVGGWELAQALGNKSDFSGLIKLQERDARVLDLRSLGK
ncbi:MAG: cation:proton antiporter [Candidatus Colwellbacteria bacterium]|nr:cation:proton antiporter [Candidatus Colwellbacteria bacterium]